MFRVNIAICDDDRVFAAEFRRKLQAVLSSKETEADITCFSDTASLLHELNRGGSYDLIFLDILLEEENGYFFAKELRKNGVETDIIFITSTEDYAVAGYETAPLFYLLKPIQDQKLEQAVAAFLKKRTPQKIVLNLSGTYVPLSLADIEYCEVTGHTTSICFASGETKTFRCALKQLEKQLPQSLFARIHSGYLLNMLHIAGLERYAVTLDIGKTLPVSQSRYNELQSKYIRYVGRAAVLI